MPIQVFWEDDYARIVFASYTPFTLMWHGHHLSSPVVNFETNGNTTTVIFVRPGASIATIESYYFYRNEYLFMGYYGLEALWNVWSRAPGTDALRYSPNKDPLIDEKHILDLGVRVCVDVPDIPNSWDITYIFPFHRYRLIRPPTPAVARQTQYCVGTIETNKLEEIVSGDFSSVEIEQVAETEVNIQQDGGELVISWNHTVPFLVRSGKIWKVKFEGTMRMIGWISNRSTNNFVCM